MGTTVKKIELSCVYCGEPVKHCTCNDIDWREYSLSLSKERENLLDKIAQLREQRDHFELAADAEAKEVDRLTEENKFMNETVDAAIKDRDYFIKENARLRKALVAAEEYINMTPSCPVDYTETMDLIESALEETVDES